MRSPSLSMPRRSSSVALAAFAVPATILLVLLYRPGLHGPFIFDDALIFPVTQLESPDYESLAKVVTSVKNGAFGRPLATLSFILDHHLFGPEPYAYKAINLGLHALNAVLVFALVRMLLSICYRSEDVDRRTLVPSLAATASAIVWAIHPLQVSTVMYVYQRPVLMTTACSIAALVIYLYVRMRSLEGRGGWGILFASFPLLLTLALLSKESGALVVGHVALMELVLFRFSTASATDRSRLTVFHSLFVALPIVLGMAAVVLKHESLLEGYVARDFDMLDRLRTQAVAVMFYLKLILIPNISDMAFFNDDFHRYREFELSVIFSAATLIALLGFAVAFRKRRPLFAIGIGIFFVSHAMESTIIPLELVFEHRNYFALLGVVLAIVDLVDIVSARIGRNRVAGILALAAIVLLSVQTYSRAVEWGDELTLAAMAVQNRPESPRASRLLAASLVTRGHHDRAIEVVVAAEGRFPTNGATRVQGMVVRCLSNRLMPADVARVKRFLAREELGPETVAALGVLSNVVQQHECGSLSTAGAVALMDIAANNRRKRMMDRYVGNLHFMRAQLHRQLGNHGAALKALEYAHHLRPMEPEVLVALTASYAGAGRVREAKMMFQDLTRIDKQRFGAYASEVTSLGQLLANREAEVLRSEMNSR